MSYSSMSGYQPPQHHHHSQSSPNPSVHMSPHNHVNQHPANHHQHHQSISHSPLPTSHSPLPTSPTPASPIPPAPLTWQTPSAPPPPAANSSNPFVEQKSGEWPSARTYFTMLEYKSRLLLFGGFGDSKGRYNDLHVYEATSGWRVQQTTGESPKPIYLHSASMYGGKMIVYGGNIGKDSNDMYILDADTYMWSRVPQPVGGQPPVAQPSSSTNPFVTATPAATTTAPSPRYGHSSCINNHQLVVVGGCRQNSVYFQDSYAYNFSTGQWRRLGDVPVDLAYHSLWSFNGQVYLFGGYNGQKFSPHLYALDNATSTWLPVRVTGAVPPACCGVACAVYGKHVYVFGGYTAQGHTDNLYRMDLERRVWEQLQATNKPLPRAYLQASVISGIMYIFGGYDGSKCVTDFKMLRLGPAVGTAAAAVPFVRPPLPVVQPPTPSVPLSSSASAPLNALFAGLNVAQPSAPAANNLSSPSAASSSSSPASSPAPQHLAAVLKEGSVDSQVEFVLKQFGAGKAYLDRKDVEALMMNLALHTPQQPPPPPHPRPTLTHSLSSSSSSSASAARFPYTASSFSSNNPAAHPRLQDIIDIGFTRAHVLHVLELMQQQGQDTRSFELVVDRCLKEQDKSHNSGYQQTPHSNGLSASELVSAQLTDKDNSRECTICMEELQDCVLRDCNHFLCCMTCGQGLIAKGLPCPVCRKNIKSCMKIYWN